MTKEQGSGRFSVTAEPGKLLAEWTEAGRGGAAAGHLNAKTDGRTVKSDPDGIQESGAAPLRKDAGETDGSSGPAPERQVFVLPVKEGGAQLLEELAAYLGNKPLELAALLAGASCPEGVASLLPASPPWAEQPLVAQPGPPSSAAAASASQQTAEAAPDRLAIAREAAQASWAAEPLLRLTALGLPPEELSRAVFAAWAAEGADPAAETADAGHHPPGAAEAPLRQRSGPSVAEWLAQAADHGRLHEPGPQLREAWRPASAGTSPATAAPPADAAGTASATGAAGAAPGAALPPGSAGARPAAVSPLASAALAALLPGVPGAAAGFAAIAERAAELARRQLEALPQPKE